MTDITEHKTLHGTIPFDKIRLEDYEPAFREAMALHNAEIDEIVNNRVGATFENTIEALEYAGEALERVEKVFFNLLEAESSDAMMAIAQKIQPELTAHANNITLNEKLFARVKAVYDQYTGTHALQPEQMKLLDVTYHTFADNGANLSEDDKQKYRELSTKLGVYALEFGQNVLNATNAYTLLLTDEADLAGLPADVIEEAARKAQEKANRHCGLDPQSPAKEWLFDLSAPSYSAFMKYADNRELRKQLYLASNTKCIGGAYDNTEHIKNIINTRLAIANLLGYKSYADKVLHKRMAKNTNAVSELLNELLDGFAAAAKQEVAELQHFAVTSYQLPVTDNCSLVTDNQSLVTGNCSLVTAYDWSYYSNKLKDSKFDLNDELIKPYFELENVRKGVFGLATKLYGISFKKNAEISVYQEDVEAFEVFDRSGEYLAVLYTDFFPRTGKRPGAWMTEFQRQQVRRNGQQIRPHISIVMNFTRPTATKPALLTFEEVNTFVHEFGHALHGMLANTVYPSLSGTSVYRDFVELPSQIMENFLHEKEFLDLFAEHYQTGAKIPAELVQKIVDSANFQVGYACLRQLSVACLDMAYHSILKPFSGDSLKDFETRAMAATQVLPTLPETMISPAFSHIFSGGYAAGYYSYKWAEVLEADAFALFKEHGIFNAEVAQSFRENILSRGGTEDPMDLYVRFRGKKPTTEALKQRCGVLKPSYSATS
ncbi:dipeptidyl carboxypeptidase Dcp [Candidatus Symbiothrix dinenymphae]|nr:dipeptidyl carboxypeptidase Dcp [Candidatus Symbiothrix dinenymphae]